MRNFHKFQYTWNNPIEDKIKDVLIEDDTLRDGMQAALIKRPNIDQKIELLNLTSQIGCQHAVLSFPRSSPSEYQDSKQMLNEIRQRALNFFPWFLGRTCIEDIHPMLRLRDETQTESGAAIFIGTSPIRRQVEKWDYSEILKQIESTLKYLQANNMPISFSLEDTTRTPAHEVKEVVELALHYGAYSIALCDTVGESTPSGVVNLVSFVNKIIQSHNSDTKILWHGHNDKGLGLANSIAAIDGGAKIISGSYLGIGERCGNTPIEQIVMYLYQSGSKLYNQSLLNEYCQTLAQSCDLDIPVNMPLVGEQAFTTCTGTHTAALVKAMAMGKDYEDYIYSGVPASHINRLQNIQIGPVSGLANVKYFTDKYGHEFLKDKAIDLLNFAKTQHKWLSVNEVNSWWTSKVKTKEI